MVKVTVSEEAPYPRDPEKTYPADLEKVMIWTENNDKASDKPEFVWLKARYHASDNSWEVEKEDDHYWVHDSKVMTWKKD